METHAAGTPSLDLRRARPFIVIHLLALAGVLWVGVTPGLIAAAVISYLVRMWAITAGYHRYFAHRSFKTSRVFQFLLALLGGLAAQKGVLWWAGHHRHHHRHSDRELDIHSPSLKGFVWAHIGWIVAPDYVETPADGIRDFERYPELRWLDRNSRVVPIAGALLLWGLAGTAVFVWAGLVATVALYHGTFTINSLSHMYGKRRFATRDMSRNNWLLALLTLGEGWHNNHHHYPGAARQGFYWWELDPVYYSLKVLSWLGIVWDLNAVPERVLAQGRRADAAA